jgi:hypothetical protein
VLVEAVDNLDEEEEETVDEIVADVLKVLLVDALVDITDTVFESSFVTYTYPFDETEATPPTPYPTVMLAVTVFVFP